mmetsp:Transcript_23329/g.64157  ORF Transcript_23329/g.64157 Transcript_23329/m.64157 type:complete len:219 (+) Transcript_23329:822-1478(+)
MGTRVVSNAVGEDTIAHRNAHIFPPRACRFDITVLSTWHFYPLVSLLQSVDIWALGVVMMKLVSGRWPSFRHPPGPRQRELILGSIKLAAHASLDDEHWSSLSASCKQLVRSMLAIRPHDRIKPEDILSHPWISGTSAPSVSLTRALEGLKELRLASLQKIVLQLMEPRLKLGCELAPLERLFSELDIKHDGAISRADLDKVPTAMRTSPVLQIPARR